MAVESIRERRAGLLFGTARKGSGGPQNHCKTMAVRCATGEPGVGVVAALAAIRVSGRQWLCTEADRPGFTYTGGEWTGGRLDPMSWILGPDGEGGLKLVPHGEKGITVGLEVGLGGPASTDTTSGAPLVAIGHCTKITPE